MEIMRYAIDGYKDVKSDKYIGIFGNPIKHTLSPIIHDTLSNELGIDERYIPFHITDKLGEAVSTAYDNGILGLNITVPYKQEVIQYLEDVDHAAKVIGAVNTLVRSERGYIGYNTDMPGLAKALSVEDVELKDANVIMLGAGGAARAVAYMCLYYGARKVYIVNRTYANAKKIADDMNETFGSERIIPLVASDYFSIQQEKYIMIQCTSVGLHENDGLPLIDDEGFYDMASVGVDLIYNPARTSFLRLMEKKGKKAINGLGMLLYQGVMAYELWNNVKIDDELSQKVYNELCKALYEEQQPVHREMDSNIVLIGYMGAGKTTVGRQLADTLGYDFIDTDEYIVNIEGMSINDIFATKGEGYFREIETKVLKEFKTRLKKTVLSTGGGLPIREENRKLLREIGKVYYLKATADTTYKRVSENNERPLLAGNNMYEKICNMLEVRMPIYINTADVLIETDNINIDEIVRKIMCWYTQ